MVPIDTDPGLLSCFLWNEAKTTNTTLEVAFYSMGFSSKKIFCECY